MKGSNPTASFEASIQHRSPNTNRGFVRRIRWVEREHQTAGRKPRTAGGHLIDSTEDHLAGLRSAGVDLNRGSVATIDRDCPNEPVRSFAGGWRISVYAGLRFDEKRELIRVGLTGLV